MEIIILTDEQRKIAEENHNLIYFFIRHCKVDEEEYYDLFAIDYLKCIEVWDKSKGNLSTLLGRAFLYRIEKENKKKKAKKRFEESYILSLDEVVFKEDINITLGDIIPSSTNVEETFELNETLNFFMKNEITKLVMFGYSQREIAKKLNCSRSNISREINYVKQELNNKLLKIL